MYKKVNKKVIEVIKGKQEGNQEGGGLVNLF